VVLRSIAPAINLRTAGKCYFSSFLHSFSLASLTSGYLWYSSFAAYASNNNSERENTIRGLSPVFALICVELRALLISGPPSRVSKVRSCKVEILIYERNARENSLFAKLIAQKRIRRPYFFNAKTYSAAKAECMCKIVKKTAEWNFSNLEISLFINLSKIYSAEFPLVFPVSSSSCTKKIFTKKYRVTGLVFKIDAINGKK